MKTIIYLVIFKIMLGVGCSHKGSKPSSTTNTSSTSESKEPNTTPETPNNNETPQTPNPTSTTTSTPQSKYKWPKNVSSFILAINANSNSPNGYTIHGLWPQGHNHWIIDCGTAQIKGEDISKIRTQMNKDWPSNSGNNFSFWRHEYNKHGSCMGIPPAKYFEMTLKVYDQEKANFHECKAKPKCRILFDLNLKMIKILP